MVNPNPMCEGDCRFTFRDGVSTAMAYYPTYDKDGNEVSKDPNIYTSKAYCSVCNRTWNVITSQGETTFKEIAK
jgi:hypothetical protein